jgi:TM2 domain-containing membrane protein YozV
MKRKLIALLLSSVILPGLGHLYLGRKVTGIAIIMVVNMLLLMMLFVVLKGLGPVIAVKVSAGAVTVSAAEVMAALHGVSGFGKGLLAAFALVWAFSIVDLLRQGNDR